MTGSYTTGVTQTDGLFKSAEDVPWLDPNGTPTIGDWFRALAIPPIISANGTYRIPSFMEPWDLRIGTALLLSLMAGCGQPGSVFAMSALLTMLSGFFPNKERIAPALSPGSLSARWSTRMTTATGFLLAAPNDAAWCLGRTFALIPPRVPKAFQDGMGWS